MFGRQRFSQGVRQASERRAAARQLRDAACFPAAGAELAAVDDAVILVAGGAEHRRASHVAVADLAVEEVADRAALIARCERKLDLVAVEPTAHRSL